MKITKILPALTIVLGLSFISACSNDETANNDAQVDLVITSTMPGDFPDDGEIVAQPRADFNDNYMEIVYTNAGSGSCQPLLTSAVLNEDTDTVILTVSDEYGSPGKSCTDDLAIVKQIVKQQDSSPFSEDTVITFNE